MSNDILRMVDNSVRDVSELPIFAEGKYENIKLALNRGIFTKPTYFYASDLEKIGYIDSNLKLHIDGESRTVQRVESLPSVNDAKDNIIYIFNNIAYLFNDGFYEPLGKDYSTEIRNIQLDITNIKTNMSGLGDRVTALEEIDPNDITEAPTIAQFPAMGKINHTYVCLSENATYRWDPENLRYICVGRDYMNIKEINGGNAEVH